MNAKEIAAGLEDGSVKVGMDLQVLASEVRDGVRVITEVRVLGASLVPGDLPATPTRNVP